MMQTKATKLNNVIKISGIAGPVIKNIGKKKTEITAILFISILVILSFLSIYKKLICPHTACKEKTVKNETEYL